MNARPDARAAPGAQTGRAHAASASRAARTNAAPSRLPIVVVTSDNELRARVTALGATVARSPALLGLATPR